MFPLALQLFRTALRSDSSPPSNKDSIGHYLCRNQIAQPTPLSALAVAGMNDVLNSQGYTQAVLWNRIPTAAWCLLIAIAICCNLLVGYGGRSNRVKSSMLFILPLFVSIAFLLIADIDSPRRGLIHVPPQNLLSLSRSFPRQKG